MGRQRLGARFVRLSRTRARPARCPPGDARAVPAPHSRLIEVMQTRHHAACRRRCDARSGTTGALESGPPPVPSQTWDRHTAGVIHEVDSALRTLIEREADGTRDVEIVFDAPTREWAGRRNSPTIDVYLYDIREDMRRRERGMHNVYEDAPGRLQAPASAALQVVLPDHRLDPATRGRAPPAVVAAVVLPALRGAARRRAHRSADRARPADPDHDRAAPAGGPGVRRRLVRARWRAQAVDRSRRDHTARHGPAVPHRSIGRAAAADRSRWFVRLADPGGQEPQRRRGLARRDRWTDAGRHGAQPGPIESDTDGTRWQAGTPTRGSRVAAASRRRAATGGRAGPRHRGSGVAIGRSATRSDDPVAAGRRRRAGRSHGSAGSAERSNRCRDGRRVGRPRHGCSDRRGGDQDADDSAARRPPPRPRSRRRDQARRPTRTAGGDDPRTADQEASVTTPDLAYLLGRAQLVEMRVA